MYPPDEELSPFNPSNDTQIRPAKNGDTYTLNPTERGVQPPWNAGEVYEDFEIKELLGRGNSGFVYRAYDRLTRRTCALKVLGRLSSRDLCRNKLGFRRMTPFRHPNLMQVDRIHVLDDRTVFAMQHVEGRTLLEAMREIRTMETQKAFELIQRFMRDYAIGLATMHLAGLVHRDIKPSNLMVTPEGRGVIIDFGLVGTCNPDEETDGIRRYLAGTPRYFSPEAVWEQLYAPPGDLFGLGLVTLECINAVRGHNDWFRMAELKDWRREQDQMDLEQAVEELNDSVPHLLRKACRGMLRANRFHRYTAMQVALLGQDGPVNVPWITKQPMFGRTQEIEQIQRWIRTIFDGKSERLHVHGPSGIGKSRLLDEVEAILEATPWCQVFRVRCRTREQHPLQVLDQIADQIASRYSRGDREKMSVDPVSAGILHEIFPQLRHVVGPDHQDSAAPLPEDIERVDALRAAMRLSVELRKIGPLIIIVDDAQWSDHDTNTVWDELQQDTLGRIGIITVSREPETHQRQAANRKIHLRPLSRERSAELLGHAAKQWSVTINTAARLELADLSGGNPFRLQELADEFRPGGELHELAPSPDSNISNLRSIDRLWQRRFDQLSESARSVLPYVVTASRPVSTDQLASLTGLGSVVDAAVSELVQQRLVNDDANGGECITIVHDKVADGLFERLTEAEQSAAHAAWAKMLTNCKDPIRYSARIANHLQASGQAVAALPFAINAAAEADRIYAKSEAGQWHERILEMVTGEAREKHLRDAARCFYEADLPERAVVHYRNLASEVANPDERIFFGIQSIDVLIRCGEITEAKPQLDALMKQLGLSMGGLLPDLLRPPVTRLKRMTSWFCDHGISLCNSADSEDYPIAKQQLALCSSVARPIAMFDLQSMVRLLLHGGEVAQQHGTLSQQAYFSSSAAVCLLLARDDKAAKENVRRMLQQFREQAAETNDIRAIAEIEASRTYFETISMRWDRVIEPMSAAIQCYWQSDLPSRFEVSQIRWHGLWADWNLGNWSHIVTVADEMVHDSRRRRDPLQHLLATGGYGGNASLICNDLARLKQYHRLNRRVTTLTEHIEIVDFLSWLGDVQSLLYQNDYCQAWISCMQFKQRLNQSLLNRLGVVRTKLDYMTALSALHMMAVAGTQTDSDTDRMLIKQFMSPKQSVKTAIKRLKRNDAPFAQMLSALLSGIELRHNGKSDQALIAFEMAQKLASQLALPPFIAASQDAIEHLATGVWTERLRRQMIDENVESPVDLERLYVVPPPEAGVVSRA